MAKKIGEGRLIYEHGTSLEEFLEENRPSIVCCPDIFWIMVLNPAAPQCFKCNPDHVIANEPLLYHRWRQLTATCCVITVDDIKCLAALTGFVSGKLVFELRREEVDDVWQCIAIATAENRLGRAAKVTSRNVSTERPGCRHVIVIYVRDFLDDDLVNRIGTELRGFGIRSAMTLTPDIYHHLGLYFNNQYQIPPVYMKSVCCDCENPTSGSSGCESALEKTEPSGSGSVLEKTEPSGSGSVLEKTESLGCKAILEKIRKQMSRDVETSQNETERC